MKRGRAKDNEIFQAHRLRRRKSGLATEMLLIILAY
jgi:hypothetical protein